MATADRIANASRDLLLGALQPANLLRERISHFERFFFGSQSLRKLANLQLRLVARRRNAYISHQLLYTTAKDEQLAFALFQFVFAGFAATTGVGEIVGALRHRANFVWLKVFRQARIAE